MRRNARVDRNQAEITKALRACGCSVLPCSNLGRGAPDLLVGIFGRTMMLEVKDGELPPSERMLTPDEDKFRDSWKGHYAVVTSVDEALKEVGIVKRETILRSKQ